MAPTLVLDNGRPVLVLGTPGGDTIPNTIVQVLRNVVDHGLTIDEAVDAPRLHHGFAPDEVRYERARPPPKPVLAALEKLGHRLSKNTMPIGDANDILLADGAAFACADRREGGLALAARARKDAAEKPAPETGATEQTARSTP
jgi:gamma-glutamyltranspeptidase/glutathione hydrolase